jgi:hypothetical protein
MLLLLGTGESIGVTSLLSATPNAWNAISGQVFANSDAVRGTFEFVIGGLIPGETVSSCNCYYCNRQYCKRDGSAQRMLALAR